MKVRNSLKHWRPIKALIFILEVKMIKLKHKKLTTIGGSKGFIIDAAYLKNGLVLDKEEYSLIIIPSKEDENNGNKQVIYV